MKQSLFIGLLCVVIFYIYYRYGKQQREEFKPLRTFYNKKHKMIRRGIVPHMDNLKQHWYRFSKKWF